jgi:hypothetical protein
MFRRLRPALMIVFLGTGLWSYGTIVVFGRVEGESHGPSGSARTVANVPPWVDAVRLSGLVTIAVGLGVGIVAVIKR